MNSTASKHLQILFRYHITNARSFTATGVMNYSMPPKYHDRLATVVLSQQRRRQRQLGVGASGIGQVRDFTDDKNNDKNNINHKDENQQGQKPPQWLHSKQRLSKTHTGDDRSRGGLAGRWGTGGGRKPPGHVIKGGNEDIVAGSKSDSSHPHVRPEDIPRLAARKSKSKTVHDSHEGLNEHQLLGLVELSQEGEDSDIGNSAGRGGDDYFEVLDEEENEEFLLAKYDEISSRNHKNEKNPDFWAAEIAEAKFEKAFQASLYGWSLDDPRLEPDQDGKYNAALDDPREEIEEQRYARGRQPPPDRVDGRLRDLLDERDPEENYFYRDFLNFEQPQPVLKDVDAINKIMPLARHGPNLDDFLEAMNEHPTKYAMVSRINEHAESQREPRPLSFPLRKNPAVEFVTSHHKAFVFAQGIDASVALGANNATYADFSNVEHRHKVAEKISKIFKVDVRHVSPANFTSAFIGFDSIRTAKIALVRYQGKLLPHQSIVGSRYSDSQPLDMTRLEQSNEVQTFLDHGNHDSILVLSNLQPTSSATLLHELFPDTLTSADVSNAPATPEDIILVSPTVALIRLPSPDAVAFLLESQTFNTKLKKSKPRAKLVILKSTREEVFDCFEGVNKSKRVNKKDKHLLVEGDVPANYLFRSHYDVLHLSNLQSGITKKEITAFFQRYCQQVRDVLSSVELIKASDGTFMGSAFVGFDGIGEAHKALVDWQARNDKHILGGNLTELRTVGEKKLIRGKKLQPRSERSAKELFEDLTHWERHADPQKLEYLESYGIGKDILDDVFIKVRYQNRSFGAIDQARVSERLEPDRAPGSRYAEFVRMYVENLCACVTTPEKPGLIVQSMFLPHEEIDLESMDGKRKWPSSKQKS